MKLKVITATSTSTIEASDAVFSLKNNPTLLAQAVRVQLSNLRQGTSKVKTRSEVNRTKAKWYRQKGTGGARHGSKNAHIFVGGGVSHGPTGLENWSKSMNRKMKSQALRVALSVQAENVVVTENLNSLKGKTAEAAKLIHKMFGVPARMLIVLGEGSELVRRSLRNIAEVLPISALEVSALDVVSASKIVLTKDALKALEARLERKEKTAKTAAKSTTKPAAKKVKKTNK
jgi:large subunit ribosomal protein L4